MDVSMKRTCRWNWRVDEMDCRWNGRVDEMDVSMKMTKPIATTLLLLQQLLYYNNNNNNSNNNNNNTGQQKNIFSLFQLNFWLFLISLLLRSLKIYVCPLRLQFFITDIKISEFWTSQINVIGWKLGRLLLRSPNNSLK